MSQEENSNRALEIAISEKVFSRLKTQMLIVYLVSIGLAITLGSSLTWRHRALAELSEARVSEYRLMVAEKLQELHRLDLEEVSIRTRSSSDCDASLPEEDAVALLTRELGRAPSGDEIRLLREKADGFGVCDIGEVQHILENPVNVAKVDTVYRLLLSRPADPIGHFIYGYWLASGVGIEAVARDIMTSPEFMRLKTLSHP